MSTIIVVIRTDHEDSDQAVKSVQNGLKRAGYDLEDFDVRDHSVALDFGGGKQMLEVGRGSALVEAREPEVEPKY